MKNPHGIQIIDTNLLPRETRLSLTKLLHTQKLPEYVVTISWTKRHNHGAMEAYRAIALRLCCTTEHQVGNMLYCCASDTYRRLYLAISNGLRP